MQTQTQPPLPDGSAQKDDEYGAILTEPLPEDHALDEDPDRGWTTEIYFKIFRMMEKCEASKRLHEESAKFYDNKYKKLSALVLTVSFLASVNGAASTLMGSVYPYVAGAINALQFLSTSLIVTLGYQVKATSHRQASQKFYELYQTVDYQLTFPAQRSSAHLFYRTINQSIGQINGRAPRPPDSVRKANMAAMTGITVVGNRDDLPLVDPTSPAVEPPPDTGQSSTQDLTSYILSRRRDYITETD